MKYRNANKFSSSNKTNTNISQITFNPDNQNRIHFKDQTIHFINNNNIININIINEQSKSSNLYPENVTLNKNFYNSNYESNANECFDVTSKRF